LRSRNDIWVRLYKFNMHIEEYFLLKHANWSKAFRALQEVLDEKFKQMKLMGSARR